MGELNTQPVTTRLTETINGLTKIDRIGHDLSFSDILKARLEEKSGVSFSTHALNRLQERGMVLDADGLSKLSNAVNKAEEKGCRDSLILVDNKAFIVSIANRTVVTAFAEDTIRNNIFTNIDSTIFT